MTNDELATIRDALVADKNGAIKYQPMLEDIQCGQGPLAMQKAADVPTIQAAVKAYAAVAQKTAIEALRLELANDPDRVGYAGKQPDAIQELLMAQIPVYADVPVPATSRDDADYLAAKIRGELYAPPDETVKVLVKIKAPPIGRVWQGIPYCRNLPSLENIIEALA